MNRPLNYYKNELKMLILASDRYFQIWRTITIYLGRGKKIEQKKGRITKKVNLFLSQTFFLQNIFGSYGSKGATRMADHSF